MCVEWYTASAPAGADMATTAAAETATLATARAGDLRLMEISFPGGNDGAARPSTLAARDGIEGEPGGAGQEPFLSRSHSAGSNPSHGS
jgi:hypothetical protein